MATDPTGPLEEIERAVEAALTTYSNVHRGSGHHSVITTRLYERAREIVLEHQGLSSKEHVVVFCTPRRAAALEERLAAGTFRCVSSEDLGLPLGVRALAIARRALRADVACEAGGGTARLVGPDWVIWAGAPDRLEPGTPMITSVIAFARGLQLLGARRGGAPGAAPAAAARDGAGHDDLAGLSGRPLLDALRRTLVGGGARVPTVDGDRPFVNLDNAASTPTFQPIWAAFRRAWRQPAAARGDIVREAASICAEALGATPTSHDVIFTSNTTEAINLVAESLAREPTGEVEPVVLGTWLEHNSNDLPWRSTAGATLLRLPVDAYGFFDLGALEALLEVYNQARSHGRKRIRLVAACGASNVLGTCNDLAALGRIVHRHGARLLVDAAQLVAHRPVDVETCGIDYLAFSGHKVYAPFGAGVLLARRGLLSFGPAELARIRASGEENVGGVAALGAALALLRRVGLDTIREEELALTRRALRGLAALPRVKVHGLADPDAPGLERRGGVIAFDVKGMLPGRVARALAERGGIGVRSGCHCAHLLVKRILGVPPWAERVQYLMVKALPRFTPPGVVRVSLGLETTESDVDAFLETLGDVTRRRAAGMGRRLEELADAAAERVFGPAAGTTPP